jgi:cytochrome c-type biogenesis protein CcmH
MSAHIDQLKQQIQQLDELARSGALPADQAAEARARLEKQLVEAVMAGRAPSASPSATASAAPSPATPIASAAAEAAVPTARTSRGLVFGMAGFVVLVSAVGYALLGRPDAWNVGPGQAASQADAAGAHTMNSNDIQGMVAKLEAKLKEDPNNAEGWGMLGRSYAAMERFQDAVDAYRKGLKLQPDNAELLSDFADSQAMLQGRKLEGEAAQAVARAIKADPNNFKALSLAGTIAFEQQDYKLAVTYWSRAVERAPADNPPLAQQLREALAEARQRAGMPPDEANNAAAAAAASAGPHVSGTVTLAPALADKVSPDDTVFIFARAASGPKMPLAIVRKQVKDLPFSFTLNDSQAMSPQMKISGFQEVVIGARISRSGQAMPQDGDFAGQADAVKVGSEDVKVEIAHPITVRP